MLCENLESGFRPGLIQVQPVHTTIEYCFGFLERRDNIVPFLNKNKGA